MTPELRESYRFCHDVARAQARNFYYSFLVLPPERRRSMCALYAFLRYADDLSDEPGDPALKRLVLENLGHDLDRSLAGEPCHWPGFPALADMIARHQLPPRHLHEVLEGCRMDLEPCTYTSFEELRRYCYLVASAVGLCCIHIWGFRSEGGRAERLAESCGIALQLTNILRDVREDALRGRVYIPREDLDRFDIAPARLAEPVPGEDLRRLFAFEGERAYQYYAEALPLVRLVAPVGRPVLRAMVGIYRALLDEIAGRDYDVLTGRVALSGWRKSAITVRALFG